MGFQRLSLPLLRSLRSVESRLSDFWAMEPFGNRPRAERERYLRLFEEARTQSYPVVDAVEKRLGHAIERAWLDELALHTQITIKKSKLCYQHGRLLYSFLRHYAEIHDADFVTVLETGTARGFSSLCMSKALSDAGVPGQIITIDVLPHTRPMYWNCVDDHEGKKTRSELLSRYADLLRSIIFLRGDSRDMMQRIALSRVNFAFLDAAHTYRDVMAEFSVIRECQVPGDVVFFDDYTASTFPGVVQAVDEICESSGYSKEPVLLGSERGYVHATKRGCEVRS